MELHEIEKQLILYTKGHFGSIDYEHDLIYFASGLYGLMPEHVKMYNIISMVISLYQKLIENSLIKFSLMNFLCETFRRSYREYNSEEVDWWTVIRQMLAEIQGMATCDGDKVLIELGSVNLNIISEKVK